MTDFPRISIVTPVFNRADMIEQTIQSVLGQHYPNLEYIIIDGGSTDGTVDIIRRYENRLAYWISEPDNGMYDAIMKGLAHATGDILAWINSDDMYHPNALNIVGQIFSQLHDVEWITGTPTLYNAEGLCMKVFSTPRWSWQRFKSGDFRWLQQESTFWRRSLWDKVGGLDMQYELAADFDLWCKMFQYAKLYSVNTILGGFREHGNQLSLTQADKYAAEVKTITVKYGMRYNTSRWRRLWNHYNYCRKKRVLVFYDFSKNQWSL